MSKVFIKPKKGILVRDPVNYQSLPPEGSSVTLNKYWRRRINDGSVSVVEPEKKKKEITREFRRG